MPVLKVTKHEFSEEWKGAAGKIASTEAKCFKEMMVKCAIFDFFSHSWRGRVTTELKRVC